MRSQDKQCLTKVNHLYITDNGDIKQQDDITLGTYKTKKRALEVLDEIQKILYAFKRIDGKEGKYEDLDLGIKVNMLNYVYEIPKE